MEAGSVRVVFVSDPPTTRSRFACVIAVSGSSHPPLIHAEIILCQGGMWHIMPFQASCSDKTAINLFSFPPAVWSLWGCGMYKLFGLLAVMRLSKADVLAGKQEKAASGPWGGDTLY